MIKFKDILSENIKAKAGKILNKIGDNKLETEYGDIIILGKVFEEDRWETSYEGTFNGKSCYVTITKMPNNSWTWEIRY